LLLRLHYRSYTRYVPIVPVPIVVLLCSLLRCCWFGAGSLSSCSWNVRYRYGYLLLRLLLLFHCYGLRPLLFVIEPLCSCRSSLLLLPRSVLRCVAVAVGERHCCCVSLLLHGALLVVFTCRVYGAYVTLPRWLPCYVCTTHWFLVAHPVGLLRLLPFVCCSGLFRFVGPLFVDLLRCSALRLPTLLPRCWLPLFPLCSFDFTLPLLCVVVVTFDLLRFVVDAYIRLPLILRWLLVRCILLLVFLPGVGTALLPRLLPGVLTTFVVLRSCCSTFTFPVVDCVVCSVVQLLFVTFVRSFILISLLLPFTLLRLFHDLVTLTPLRCVVDLDSVPFYGVPDRYTTLLRLVLRCCTTVTCLYPFARVLRLRLRSFVRLRCVTVTVSLFAVTVAFVELFVIYRYRDCWCSLCWVTVTLPVIRSLPCYRWPLFYLFVGCYVILTCCSPVCFVVTLLLFILLCPSFVCSWWSCTCYVVFHVVLVTCCVSCVGISLFRIVLIVVLTTFLPLITVRLRYAFVDQIWFALRCCYVLIYPLFSSLRSGSGLDLFRLICCGYVYSGYVWLRIVRYVSFVAGWNVTITLFTVTLLPGYDLPFLFSWFFVAFAPLLNATRLSHVPGCVVTFVYHTFYRFALLYYIGCRLRLRCCSPLFVAVYVHLRLHVCHVLPLFTLRCVAVTFTVPVLDFTAFSRSTLRLLPFRWLFDCHHSDLCWFVPVLVLLLPLMYCCLRWLNNDGIVMLVPCLPILRLRSFGSLVYVRSVVPVVTFFVVSFGCCCLFDDSPAIWLLRYPILFFVVLLPAFTFIPLVCTPLPFDDRLFVYVCWSVFIPHAVPRWVFVVLVTFRCSYPFVPVSYSTHLDSTFYWFVLFMNVWFPVRSGAVLRLFEFWRFVPHQFCSDLPATVYGWLGAVVTFVCSLLRSLRYVRCWRLFVLAICSRLEVRVLILRWCSMPGISRLLFCSDFSVVLGTWVGSLPGYVDTALRYVAFCQILGRRFRSFDFVPTAYTHFVAWLPFRYVMHSGLLPLLPLGVVAFVLPLLFTHWEEDGYHPGIYLTVVLN